MSLPIAGFVFARNAIKIIGLADRFGVQFANVSYPQKPELKMSIVLWVNGDLMPCKIQKENDNLKQEVAKLKATIRSLQAKILEMLRKPKK